MDNNIKEMDRLPPDHHGLTLDTNEVRRVLCSINARKTTGPDGVPEFRACADQLTVVFINIFNLSLTYAVVLTCFK